MVTDEQVRLLRRKRMEGKSQETAAAIAGMSVRTARTWEAGPLPSQVERRRGWRTRPDPFAEVWDTDVEPLLVADEHGRLEAKTLMEELIDRHPEQFSMSQLRTMQRRVRDWRALNGPPKEVFFEQEHVPGREASVDFTHAEELGVRIAGEPFSHLLFQFRLAFSGWIWVMIALGETYEALVSGIQGALRALGGVPDVICTDNLSAATHELKKGGGRSLNRRFREFIEHMGTKSRRIRPGRSNENGVVEKGHDLVKSALEQALVLRGNRDFADAAAYLAFVRDVVEKSRNRHVADRLAEERRHLESLPAVRFPEYTRFTPKVRRWSTARVGGRAYSVPSRLIGHKVEARQYADRVEIRYHDKLVETFPRLRGERQTRIDYRHIIWSLVRKPGAFARYRFREELFPTPTFRSAYDRLVRWRGDRADVEYVRILHLAASTMQGDVEGALVQLLEQGDRFDYARLKSVLVPRVPEVPRVNVAEPDLEQYDRLIGGAR